MQSQDVKTLLDERLESCDFHVRGEGCDFQVIAVGEVFASLTPVRRQQFIYEALTNEIASGEIHAVSIKTYTPAQWQTAPENTGS